MIILIVLLILMGLCIIGMLFSIAHFKNMTKSVQPKPTPKNTVWIITEDFVNAWTKAINSSMKQKDGKFLPNLVSDSGEAYSILGIGKNGITCYSRNSGGYDSTFKHSFDVGYLRKHFSTQFEFEQISDGEPMQSITQSEYNLYLKWRSDYQLAQAELDEILNAEKLLKINS